MIDKTLCFDPEVERCQLCCSGGMFTGGYCLDKLVTLPGYEELRILREQLKQALEEEEN